VAGHFVAKGPLRGQLTREIRGHFVAEFQYLLISNELVRLSQRLFSKAHFCQAPQLESTSQNPCRPLVVPK